MSAKSSVSGSFNFVDRTIEAFSKIFGEIDERGGELDFRDSFLRHFVRDILDWKKEKGEGHYITREKEDIRLHNDADICIALIETKNPKNKLKNAHRKELKDHLDDSPTARYGMLTNGHQLKFFKYSNEDGLNKLVSINMDEFVSRGVESLTKSERQDIYLLRRLVRGRCIKAKPKEFTENVQKIPVEEKFDLFIKDLRYSLDELTWIIGRLFRFYWKASPQHYGGKFLREDAYKKWKGASTGKEEELQEKFCRETAYVFLNRILFTRILEDKKILEPRVISGEEFAKCLRLFGSGAYRKALDQAYENVEKFYEHFYELGIFDWWHLSKEKRGMLTDEEKKVQEEIEEDLFAVVIRDVLRNLNKYNFRGVNRDILGDVYQEYLPPEERKRLGEFYTPIEVVRYILDAIGYIPENRIEDKLILDPACGSGTFLVEASNRLMDRYGKKGLRLRDPDDCKIILSAITSNIHGLDINPFACHIAEMNLLFTVIDLLNAVQRKYKMYKLGRFNVCQADSLVPPGEEQTTVGDFVNGRIKAWTEEARRANRVKRKRFGFVVGNPPYVRQEIIKEMKESLSEWHPEVFHGRADLCVYFYSKGIKWLDEGGKLGYISNNMFVRRIYGKKLKKFISRTCNILIFTDFGDSGVFKEATNYPCILIIEKRMGEEAPEYAYYAEIDQKPEDISNADILRKVEDTIAKDKEAKFEGFEIFKVRHPEPSGAWALIPIKREEVLLKIEKSSSGNLRNYREGIQMGQQSNADKVHIIDESVIKDYQLEEELLKPLVRGAGIRRWGIHWDGEYLIFPYHNVEGKDIVIRKEEMIKKYPHMWDYLSQKGNKKTLKGRHYLMKKIREGTRQEFYELWIPKKSQLFENPKILTPDISNTSNFAYDEEGYYVPTTGFAIVLGSEFDNRSGYLYFLGLLNSEVLEFYFKHKSPFIGGKYFRYNKSYLDDLPVKLPQNNNEKVYADEIRKSVEQILRFKSQFKRLEDKIEGFPKTYSPKIVRKVSKVAEDYKELTREKYKIKSPKVKKLSKKIHALVLDGKNNIKFDSQESAKYVLEWIKRRKQVKRKELLDFEIPSEKEVVKVMKEFFRDKEKVKELKSKRNKLKKEIDDLVYKLYGLDEKDQKIIEEFLEKF